MTDQNTRLPKTQVMTELFNQLDTLLGKISFENNSGSSKTLKLIEQTSQVNKLPLSKDLNSVFRKNKDYNNFEAFLKEFKDTIPQVIAGTIQNEQINIDYAKKQTYDLLTSIEDEVKIVKLVVQFQDKKNEMTQDDKTKLKEGIEEITNKKIQDEEFERFLECITKQEGLFEKIYDAIKFFIEQVTKAVGKFVDFVTSSRNPDTKEHVLS